MRWLGTADGLHDLYAVQQLFRHVFGKAASGSSSFEILNILSRLLSLRKIIQIYAYSCNAAELWEWGALGKLGSDRLRTRARLYRAIVLR